MFWRRASKQQLQFCSATLVEQPDEALTATEVVVNEIGDEDLERLANRVALLVSEDGEADNAGRAVAALARRMGLTGGDLKSWMLSGALIRRGQPDGNDGPLAGTVSRERLESDISSLQHGLRLTEAQLRNTQSERDALKEENGLLIEALDRSRSSEQVRNYVGLAVVAAAILGGLVLYAGPSLHAVPGTEEHERPFGSPFLRSGVIRTGGAIVLRAPQTNALQVTQLAAGARVQVRQMVQRDLLQWAEVEVGGVVGYVMSTQIELQDPTGK